MAIGRYPIPPPNARQLMKIFGSQYDASMDLLPPASTSAGSQANSPLNKHFGSNHSASGDVDDVPQLSIFALLDYIVKDPPPTLPRSVFTPEFVSFVDSCLKKNPQERPDLNGLMVRQIEYSLHFFTRRSLLHSRIIHLFEKRKKKTLISLNGFVMWWIFVHRPHRLNESTLPMRVRPPEAVHRPTSSLPTIPFPLNESSLSLSLSPRHLHILL